MKIAKLLFLPILMVASVATAQQGLLTVSVENKHLTAQVDYASNAQEFTNEADDLKVLFQQDGDNFLLEVYVKNEDGAWELLRDLEVPAIEGTELSKGTAIPSFDGIVTLQTIE